VELLQAAASVALAMFTSAAVLGVGELLNRAVERLLFPSQARMARQVEAARSEAAALRSRVERLERLALAGELAAQVAHEIKNPLAAVRGYAELLEAGVASLPGGSGASLAQAARVIREESDRIDARVGVLLRLGHPAPRLAAPGLTLELNRVAAEALAVVEGQPGVPPLRSVLCSEPLPVAGDPDALRGALLNLLKNAAEAMAGCPGSIELRTAREGSLAVAEVRDQGPGLAAGVESRLFEPFQTTKPTGTGLGLVIVRTAVEALGGRVSLRGRTDRSGALARIEMPLAGARSEGAGQP